LIFHGSGSHIFSVRSGATTIKVPRAKRMIIAVASLPVPDNISDIKWMILEKEKIFVSKYLSNLLLNIKGNE